MIARRRGRGKRVFCCFPPENAANAVHDEEVSFPPPLRTASAGAQGPPIPPLPPERRGAFRVLGTSCHSVEDAREAEKLGCTYITAGHVFATDCKKGLAPRGLDFLRAVCRAVDLPVWAIGGITPENFPSVRAAGARGGCVMSGLMTCADPAALLERFARRD